MRDLGGLCCIFDLDGVLVDTAKYHYLAWKRLAKELGFEFSEQQNERLKGVSRMASLDILLEVGGIKGLSAEAKQDLATKKNTWYVAYINQMTPDEILPGVLDFLQQLKDSHVKTALGSASRNAPLILERVHLAHFFDAIIDGNTITKAKPDPEVFLLGAQALGVPPDNCVVFEDAEAGVEAALRAGMKCVGVGNPNILHKATVVIPGFEGVTWEILRSPTSSWKIIEDKFDPERVKASESLFSIGNGKMGQRANFEEAYSGETLQGSYIGGVYYPDKTRVGWWKNGYPEYFAKVLNSAFWIGIDVKVNGETLDLHTAKVLDFYHELDMQHGVLTRRFIAELSNKIKVAVEAVRFVSITRTGLGAISYTVQPLNSDADIEITPFTNANVKNEDANYDEKFWDFVTQSAAPDHSSIVMRTKKTNFSVCWHSNWISCLDAGKHRASMQGSIVPRCREASRLDAGKHRASMQGSIVPQCKEASCIDTWSPIEKTAWVGASANIQMKKDERFTLYKYTGIASAQNGDTSGLTASAKEIADDARQTGFLQLKEEHAEAWLEKWRQCDVEIGGDEKAQQGIRFCIFQLLQTYTGEDARLNVGPKGFTGEKYGGSTYWDTEAYCLPFYLATAGDKVARNLLLYRYNQLPQAIENARKLGFTDGAALYPMVTMNGEECHNEWEITFEEIHRNGAIAYAIFNYIRYTGDRDYLAAYGLEVLIGIARFWAQRITWSEERNKYVMLGVTGPNEYENNVNNNWYTNYIACWCLRYTKESMEWMKQEHASRYDEIIKKTHFDELNEWMQWDDVTAKMHFPYHEKLKVFLQQDGYMDKEQILAKDLDPAQRPLNQKWSWDRILRSCFIKQADVLQGLYFFEDDFDEETIRRNFQFYEARTVHESSLSPCVHAVLAAKIGDMGKAYEMYLRTSRLDLDDYNKEVGEGLHITSMAGSWLAVIQGFAGMRVQDGKLTFNPRLPAHWTSLSFNVNFRGEIRHCKF